MLEIRILPLKHLWWKNPKPLKQAKGPGRRKRAQEVDPDLPTRKRQTLAFQPSRRWVRYTEIESVDRGYITELYNLRGVAKRYGLSQQTARYWRDHILPEPFTVSNVKNVRAFYWSRIQLSVIDAVLRDLESQGRLTIRQTYKEHLALIDHGCDVLEDHYSEKYDKKLYGYDKHGVKLL